MYAYSHFEPLLWYHWESSMVSEKFSPRLMIANSPFLVKTKSCFAVKCMSTLLEPLRHSDGMKKCRFTWRIAPNVRRLRLQTHRSVSRKRSIVPTTLIICSIFGPNSVNPGSDMTDSESGSKLDVCQHSRQFDVRSPATFRISLSREEP